MEPALSRVSNVNYAFEGPLADYLEGVTQQWLLIAPDANPAMLDMFADRDRRPYRDQVPWAGEFAGKYLTSAVQILRLTGDSALKEYLGRFVDGLIAHQDRDGYLGPWPMRNRLTGVAPNVMGKRGATWDAWGHYHVMLGLLLWSEEEPSSRALHCVERMAELFARKFRGTKRRRLVDTGSTEMNLAPVHVFCMLYRRTGKNSYLQQALNWVDEFAAIDSEGQPLAGDYLNQALIGQPFFKTPKPRWESLHPIMALAELYWITGEDQYRLSFEQIWWSIVELDRHNNGGFSSGEAAQGNPYHRGPIETCCTIAWTAMSIEMLKLTGNPIVADEIELSTLNSILGLHSASGRWVTYNTPMDGVRKASAHDIVFQAREGSPELNCCSVNGPRGLGMVSDWALMCDGEGLVLNWYGPGRIETRLVRGDEVAIVGETEYPRRGAIKLRVEPEKSMHFVLKLRIPYWSERTRVRVNGKLLQGVRAGTYFAIDRCWQNGDCIALELDMSLHYWRGAKECRNKTSIFRGPILLTYDRKFNQADPAALPLLDAAGLRGRLSKTETIVALDVQTKDGGKIRLCDFASAGEGGSPYRSWLRVDNVTKIPFSRENPLRSGR